MFYITILESYVFQASLTNNSFPPTMMNVTSNADNWFQTCYWGQLRITIPLLCTILYSIFFYNKISLRVYVLFGRFFNKLYQIRKKMVQRNCTWSGTNNSRRLWMEEPITLVRIIMVHLENEQQWMPLWGRERKIIPIRKIKLEGWKCKLWNI